MKRFMLDLAVVSFVLLLLCVNGWGCAGSAVDGDEPEPPACETFERDGHLRCTSRGVLELNSCGEWFALEQCAAPELCSPGPMPGCRVAQ